VRHAQLASCAGLRHDTLPSRMDRTSPMPANFEMSCARSALLILAALVSSRPAWAAELLIAAPAACPVDDELPFRAEQALGQPLDSAADVRCTVHITHDGASYVARLEVQAMGSAGPARERLLRAPSCEKLTETLALAVSLAVASGAERPAPSGPERAAAASVRSSSSETAITEDVSSDANEAAPSDVATSRRDGPGLRVAASAALVADAGSLPGVGAGVALGAALGLGAFELRGLGTYLPPRSASVEISDARAGAEIELLAGSLLVCAPRIAQPSARVDIGACAGAELGWLQGSGSGVDVARSGGSWWTAARADAEARWGVGRGFGVGLALSALIPWDRDQFAIAGVGRVFRPGRVIGRATLGLSYEFGATSE